MLRSRRYLIATIEIKKKRLIGVASIVHCLVPLSALGQLLGIVQRLDDLRVLIGDRLLGDAAGASVALGFDAADLPPVLTATVVPEGGLGGAGGELVGGDGRGDGSGGRKGNGDNGELHGVCLGI